MGFAGGVGGVGGIGGVCGVTGCGGIGTGRGVGAGDGPRKSGFRSPA